MANAGGQDTTTTPTSNSARGQRAWLRDGERASCFRRRITQPVDEAYQRYFAELVLREKPLPPSRDGRHVPLSPGCEPLVDERRGHAYISNSIRSSRYTLWDFLPKQIIFQATRLHNAFFICIGVPQTIPGLSTTGNYTTIIPLLFFIILTVVKEGYDDWCRHRLDKVENNSLANVLRSEHGHDEFLSETRLSKTLSTVPDLLKRQWTSKSGAQHLVVEAEDSGGWRPIKWHSIQVGDIISLKRDEPVPADIALLHATGEDGIAYIETMALDGETNLKTKQAPQALQQQCHRVSDLKDCHAAFVLEDPNKNLYDFQGKVTIDGKTLPLTLNEVVFRGSILRNTDLAIGIVINTGEECKIRMNANHHPKAKRPRLERYANQVVLTLIFYVIVISVGLFIGYLLWHDRFETGAWYLNNGYPLLKQVIIGYLIMFNNVIPLALYVSLEIVKIGQMLMVQSDREMYDEETNTAMTCNTNTILENLGQVSYILSDKTGTLTENVMRFRGISLGGIVWNHDNVNESRDFPKVDDTTAPVGHSANSTDNGEFELDTFRPSTDKRGVFVEEREVPTISIRGRVEPRGSNTFSSRRSASQPRLPETQRTTKDLLEIIRRDPASTISRKAKEFILGMALCHTALPEFKDGNVDFQASSPDELALVRAAQDLGFLMIQRSSQRIELSVTTSNSEHIKESYDILDVIEFSSQRKRMTVVLRCPNGQLWLICKGADSAIIPRLRQSDLAARRSRDVRRSMDIERRTQRKSEHHEPRNSFGGRPSLNVRRSSGDVRPSLEIRPSLALGRATLEVPGAMNDVRHSLQDDLKRCANADDSALFTKCFQHIDEFASEGLRTLLYAHKYLSKAEYVAWKKVYQEATTSLVNRQENIEAAGEMIERDLDLLGASAIEDKLQKGVPETIDRLRRANIRIWMLTGDKRETAINIAHSARLCQPTSLVYILDATKGDLHGQMSAIVYDDDAHRVAVIDGHTLSIITGVPDLRNMFFTALIANVDSVIVCRASPSQKAEIVQGIRARLPGLTLAIGDGANDIAMIQAAHVGIGISGKEGLQAARVADYSIAQFRFLQRLLLVHGRYEYVRTAKFILFTFWKEMYFYLMQALYQRHNGYTGTSLYESWSLTALNTLFTSLCVIVPGIFEKDLAPNTLLAVPELYTYGQRNQGLNLRLYASWMLHAAANGLVVWFICWASYGHFNVMGDNGLFALGDMCFTLGIIWTNYKLLVIETNYKTLIVGVSLVVTVGGWFAWTGFMSGIYPNNLSPYDVKGGFGKGFGTELTWWLTVILAFAVLATMELVYGAVKRNLIAARMWPPWRYTRHYRNRNPNAEDMELELWQEMERDPKIREQLRAMAVGEDDEHVVQEDD